MARMPTQRPNVGHCTICLSIDEAVYNELIHDPVQFRAWLAEQFELHPELFPEHFANGFSMNDSRTSRKLGVVIRRIELRDGSAWSIRPSFVLPGMTARVDDVHDALLSAEIRRAVLGVGQGFRTESDVLAPLAECTGARQSGRHYGS
jgi:hypothetical protein